MPDVQPKSISARSTPEELRARMGARSASRGAPRPLRERIVEALKTFLWVAPLTILIWIYAEREQQASLGDVPVPIEVRSTSPDRIVTLESGEAKVMVDLQGPQARLTMVRDSLAAAPVTLMIGDEIPIGPETPIPVTDRLAKEKVFTDNAITITRARPPVIRVRVDRKLTISVPVRPSKEVKLIGDPPKFDPPTVQVTGPAAVLERIQKSAGEPLAVYADLAAYANKQPGHYVADAVPLSFPNPYRGENITFPKSVKADITIRPSEPLKVDGLPIFVAYPSVIANEDKYKVTLSRPTLSNINVVGPPEAIQAMKDPLKPQGIVILRLTADDMSRLGPNTKTIDQSNYELPPGVTVVNPVQEIAYTITERGG